MSSFREMICENVYNSHLILNDGITQLGYDEHELKWFFTVVCSRCGKASIVDRQTLDNMLYKDYGKPKRIEPPTTEPDSK